MKWLNITNIDWDTDGENVPELPQNLQYLADEDEVQDPSYIADRLSDEYGFCVNSYEVDVEDYEDL